MPLDILRSVLSLPTAPFHEHHVAAFVRQFANERGLPVTEDEFGNLIVRYQRGSETKPIALVAHTDHPGFEVAEVNGSEATLLAFGDTRGANAVGTRIRFYSTSSLQPRGVGVIRAIAESHPQTSRNEKVIADVIGATSVGDFATWDLPSFHQREKRIYSRAIDDPAGVAALLSTLHELVTSQAHADVYGVFTRAEEVGFVGATALAQAEGLPKTVPVISIEMSKALPGAEQGEGFVVRLGDRASLFEPSLTNFLLNVAREMAAHNNTFKFQQRLMDGGSCEATAFNVAGYVASGVCLPLGNYHNQSADGIAPEFIHEDDYLGLVRFLTTLAENMTLFDSATSHTKNRVQEYFQHHRDKLLATKTVGA
jgi:endoglucanase